MLRVLIKSRFQALFYSLFKAKRGKKKTNLNGSGVAKGIGIAILAAYVIGCVLLALGSMFYQLCEPMVKGGYTWLYFSLVGMMTVALCFIGSVFTTQTQLYDAKDNELLLSMPIPPRYILASRMIMLLGLNYIYELLVVLPAVVVYCVFGKVTVLSAIVFIIGFLILPFLVMTLSCIIGWLVALITSRMRNKTIFTLVLSLGFLAAYFYIYSQMSNYMQSILENMGDIAEAVKKAFFPLYHLGVSIQDGNGISLLWFLACAILPFALIYLLLSKSFIHMATTKRGAARVVYKEKQLKVSSPKGALLRKELKHFTNSAMYMMNAALGVVFLVVGAVLLLIRQETLLATVKELKMPAEYVVPFLIALISGITVMNFITAPSISLEGKNLWIAQSIPVKTLDVLMAKVDMHLVVCIPPVIFASIVSIFVVKADLLEAIMLLLLPILYTIFAALFGLVLNLKFPKFDWINETVAVKQSLSGFLAMFGSWAMLILPVILYIFLFMDLVSIMTYLWIVSVLMALICLALFEYIKHRGTKIFTNLSN